MLVVAPAVLALALVAGPTAAQESSADTSDETSGGADCVIFEDATTADLIAAFDGVAELDPCAAIEEEINRQPIETLERVLIAKRLRTIAQFLRANPEVVIPSFTYVPQVRTVSQWCCSCVPGQTCSSSILEDVCTFNPDGEACPAGELRALCDFFGEQGQLCTAID
jgi:hypothetical protein